MKRIRKWKSQSGFTLAELLVVIGIVVILSSIGILGLGQYQKSLKLMQMDATAREIFVAAQNHIVTAQSSGEWDRILKEHEGEDAYFGADMTEQPADYPEPDNWPSNGKGEGHDFRYILYTGQEDDLENTILEVLLPFGAIDEQVRHDETYVIEYDLKTATVYGVFYTENSRRFSYSEDIMGIAGLDVSGGREDSSSGKSVRKNYHNASGRIIIGYYGGASIKKIRTMSLEVPEIEVKNADTLQVTVRDKNYGRRIDSKVRFTVYGEESKASKTVVLERGVSSLSRESWWTSKIEGNTIVYTVTLDDITVQGGHFADIFPDLIPGENLLIIAEVFSNDVFAKTVQAHEYTNSLFSEKVPYEESGETIYKAVVKSIRHLQNLSPEISNLPNEVSSTRSTENVQAVVKRVEQVANLNQKGFTPSTGNTNWSIYKYHENVSHQEKVGEQKFYGIYNPAIESYEGNGYTISNLQISEHTSGNAGLFAVLGSDRKVQKLKVQNLILKDFTVESFASGGDTGALIGRVHANSSFEGNKIYVVNPTVKSSGGASGGLAGSLRGETEGSVVLQSCGVYLEEKTDALGAVLSTEMLYQKGAYSTDIHMAGNEYVVSTRGGNAGGIVGLLQNATVVDSFASIPVSGGENGTAGGFVGRTQNGNAHILRSYVGGYTENGTPSKYYGISASGNQGIAGGFIGKNDAYTEVLEGSFSTASVYGTTAGGFWGEMGTPGQLLINTYAAGTVSGGTGAVLGSFVGNILNEINLYDSFYLKDYQIAGQKEYSGISAITFDELAAKASSQQSNREVHTYGMLGDRKDTYPFPLVTNAGAKNTDSLWVYYGDWLEKSSQLPDRAGIIYYEIVDGQFYYHGYVGKFSAGNTTPEYQEIYSNLPNTEKGLLHEKGKYVTEDGYLLLFPKDTDESLLGIRNLDWEMNTISQWAYKIGQFSSVTELSAAYDMYSIFQGQNEGANWVGVGLLDPNNTTQFSQEVRFNFDFRYGDAIKQVLSDTDPRISEMQIRSPRQLNNVADSWNAPNIFYQTLDIRFDGVSQKTIGFFIGSYIVEEGTNYSISGLTNTVFETIDSTGSVTNVLLEQSTISQGVPLAVNNNGTITNSKVTETVNVAAGESGFVKNNTGYIGECVSSAQVNSTGSAAGFVDANNGSGTIQNSQFLGNVSGGEGAGFARYNSGKIENCSTVDVTVKANNHAIGFVEFNEGNIVSSTVKNSNLESQDAVSGSAAGFVKDNTGVLQGCTVEEIQIKGQAQKTAGFAIVNHGGQIESCVVRASVDTYQKDGYQRVMLQNSSGSVAGFIDENSTGGSIRNSYVIGTLLGNTTSGFVRANVGNIESCYTNVLQEANGEAVGFVTEHHEGSIKNSFVTGRIQSNQDIAYGFIKRGTSLENCYSAPFNLSGKTIVYFGYSWGTARNCFWLNSSYTNGVEDTTVTESGDASSYVDLKTQGTKLPTYKYKSGEANIDTAQAEYPFSGSSTQDAYRPMEFWGDWPAEEVTLDAGLVYYEIIDGEFYYHGYGGKFSENNVDPQYREVYSTQPGTEKGLIYDKGKYVSEEGYLLLLPKGANVKLMSMTDQDWGTGVFTDWIEDFSYTETQYPAIGEISKLYDIYHLKRSQSPAANFVKIGFLNMEWGWYFVQEIKFNFDGLFGDAVEPFDANNSQRIHKVQIRAPRHVNNIGENYATTNNLYTQSLDIKFDASHEQKTVQLLSGDYVVERERYTISGLTKPFIDTIRTGSIKGVTIEDSQIEGEAVFALTNESGIVDSCVIHASSPENNGYDKVTLKNPYGLAAGFIKNNNGGTIRNSYFVGTVSASTVSGFVNNNNGTIENCYANAILLGQNETNGFASINTSLIQHSFAVGRIQSSNGKANGFINMANGRLENCYTAPFQITGVTVSRFGSGWGTITDCYWLNSSYVEGTIDTQTAEKGAEATYDQLAAQGSKLPTYKYNSNEQNAENTLTEYPFSGNSTQDAYRPMEFWGDWPAKDSIVGHDVGVLYYEIVDGEFYYHGYLAKIGANNSSTYREIYSVKPGTVKGLLPDTGKVVTEDGYRFLLPYGANTNKKGISISSSANKFQFQSLRKNNSGTQDGAIEGIIGYDMYSTDLRPGMDMYLDIGEKQGQGFSRYAMFEFSPSVANGIWPVGTHSREYEIRTARQLSELSQLSEYDVFYEEDVVWRQTFDIDFANTEFTQDGVSIAYDFQTIPFLKGQYRSELYEGEAYSIKGLDAPMFESIEERAVVQGVVLQDSKVEEKAALAIYNAGLIDSCYVYSASESIVESEDSYIDTSVTHTEEAAGFVYYNMPDAVISNSSYTGVVSARKSAGFAYVNEGTITNSYANARVSGEERAAGFVYSNQNGGCVTSSFSTGSVIATQEGGVAYGFAQYSEDGILQNAYAAPYQLDGSYVYRFANANIEAPQCYWLNVNYVWSEELAGECGTGISYEELSQMAQMERARGIVTEYPFPLMSMESEYTMEFHGDWPAMAEPIEIIVEDNNIVE